MAPFNVPHLSMADAVVAGYFIPKGSHVLLSRVGLGRNPRIWEEPLRFKPERHMNDDVVDLAEPELRFISFSTGRRVFFFFFFFFLCLENFELYKNNVLLLNFDIKCCHACYSYQCNNFIIQK